MGPLNSVVCADTYGVLILVGAYFGGWVLSKFVDLVVYRNQSNLTDKEQNLLVNMNNCLRDLEKNQDKMATRLEDMQKSQVLITAILEELVRKKPSC